MQFDHVAEQISGTFELRGGEVKLAGRHPLGVRASTITGADTIDANLSLGHVGGRTTAVTIRPGIEDAVGTITITKSWQMFSSSGQN